MTATIPAICSTPSRRAMTLLELLLGLAIVAILSAAVAAMTSGTLRTTQYVEAQEQAQSEINLAIRRMVYNIRTASAVPAWVAVSGINQLQLAHTGVTGVIAYYIDSSGNLVESDSRYNVGTAPSILVHNVGKSNFACAITAKSSTQLMTLVHIDLVVPGTPAVERHVYAACRAY